MAPAPHLVERVFCRLCQQGHINGQQLAREYQVSRAAIWKAIQRLREMGVPIQTARGAGYRLGSHRPLQPLDFQNLAAQLGTSLRCQGRFTTASTNDDARTLSADGFVLAEHQSNGRGRMGRHWMSVPGCSVVLSGRWQLTAGLSDLAGLNLAVAMAVIDAVTTCGGRPPGVKWPNDLMVHDANGRLHKTGGILIEISGEMEGPCCAIVGLGLNWALPEECQLAIEQPVANLTSIWPDQQGNSSAELDRPRFIGALMERLDQNVRRWCEANPSQSAFRQQILQQWHAPDVLLNQPVRVHQLSPASSTRYESYHRGVYRGVTADGALRLESHGQVHCVHSGEVSIRPQAPGETD